MTFRWLNSHPVWLLRKKEEMHGLTALPFTVFLLRRVAVSNLQQPTKWNQSFFPITWRQYWPCTNFGSFRWISWSRLNDSVHRSVPSIGSSFVNPKKWRPSPKKVASACGRFLVPSMKRSFIYFLNKNPTRVHRSRLPLPLSSADVLFNFTNSITQWWLCSIPPRCHRIWFLATALWEPLGFGMMWDQIFVWYRRC